MKLEEKFIRTYDGNIAQINILDKENNPLVICSIKGKGYMVSDIKKASHNIIDLIEVGDYVNGELVQDITGEYIRIGDASHNKQWLQNNIKTILTKE